MNLIKNIRTAGDDLYPDLVSLQYYLQILTAIKSAAMIPGAGSTCGSASFDASSLLRFSLLLVTLGIEI